ncbi:MAG: hypothetical protein MZV64_25945 [Ignavibacteriales bacterium]|nr:hypothetical protein [Ignavibacteriales bacterium]
MQLGPQHFVEAAPARAHDERLARGPGARRDTVAGLEGHRLLAVHGEGHPRLLAAFHLDLELLRGRHDRGPVAERERADRRQDERLHLGVARSGRRRPSSRPSSQSGVATITPSAR